MRKMKTKKAVGVLALLGALLIVLAGLMAVQYTKVNSIIAGLESTIQAANTEIDSLKRTRCTVTDQLDIPANTATNYSLVSAGHERSYQVHTPADYDPNIRYPVVLSFDGIDGSGERMRGYSQLDSLPAIVVYPNSIKGTKRFTAWQGAPYSLPGDYDVQFVRDILAQLPAQYCLEANSTFAIGMSNGGAFATIVGCELGDQIKAVASVSGAYYTTCAQEQRTPSLLIIHSKGDTQIPLGGAQGRKLPDVPSWAVQQATDRTCGDAITQSATSEVAVTNWSNCKNDSVLRLVVLPEQRHGWLVLPEPNVKPDGNQGDNTADYIWAFFKTAG